MKKLTIFLILFSALYFAQNQRFMYEYKFVMDSTNKEDVKNELMYLDAFKEGSHFYSRTVFESDSIMKADLEKQLKATGSINVRSDMRKGDVRYSVTKTYPKYDVFMHTRLLSDQYKVAEDRKMNWKISSEKQKIGEWNAQKAETDFGGRHWIAWFSTDIPVQDGPYKFHGLPGIIVKLEDRTGTHRFELKGIKNSVQKVEMPFSAKEIAINRKQYNRLVEDYENDPTKGYRQMQMGGMVMIMADGQSADMKKQEEIIKERLRKNNNKIELKRD